MAKFYGLKILNQEINAKTGEPWQITDVPKYWRSRVEEWLASNH